MRRLCYLLFTLTSLLAVAPAAQARALYAEAAATTTAAGEELAAATVTMGHLPLWVQVSGAWAPLYSSDGGSQVRTRVNRYGFLRVLGAGVSRLQVDAYNDQGQVTQRGFVDADEVLPSAPGTNWLVSSADTVLYRGADAAADGVRNVTRFTALQQVDGPVQGRIEVKVYASDFTVYDQGWIDASVTGPALAPQLRVAAPGSVGLSRAGSAASQQAFLDAVGGAARAAQAQTGVPASVTVAQAILESDWGRSTLATGANNYFGVKALGRLGTDGVVWMPTSEYDDAGELYQTISPFRAYKNLTDSLLDHDRLLVGLSRYAPAMAAKNDPREFATRLMSGGYSTDPAYADKLVGLMDRYNLYALDSLTA